MVSQEFSVGGIVKGYEDGVLSDPNVTFQALKEIAGQMGCVPIGEWFAQALAQLMDGGLGQQRHGQLTVADI